jgi:MurNAc alpha-1-phosphate uridylyltransferase
MRVMLLAAGRGERMGPLTEHRPKPMLEVAGRPLIAHHLAKLHTMGFREVVINTSYLGDQIHAFCGDGSAFGLDIVYSPEPERLETAGGIIQALPLLGSDPFWVINADVWCDYQPFPWVRLPPGGLASLIMVDNPLHHPIGDFAFTPSGRLANKNSDADFAFTYAGIGVYSPALFEGWESGVLPLRPVLEQGIRQGLVFGERFRGYWCDVGTPARLASLDKMLAGRVS